MHVFSAMFFLVFVYTHMFRLQDGFWRAVRHTDGPDGQILAGLGPSREARETCLTERWGEAALQLTSAQWAIFEIF
jgi:hypothetical protein